MGTTLKLKALICIVLKFSFSKECRHPKRHAAQVLPRQDRHRVNVTPRAIGVIVNKRVNTRIIPKRIHVRVEHVSHSKCRLDFLNRVKENEAKRAAARKSGKPLTAGALRRLPRQPARGFLVSAKKTEVLTIRPLPHVNMV